MKLEAFKAIFSNIPEKDILSIVAGKKPSKVDEEGVIEKMFEKRRDLVPLFVKAFEDKKDHEKVPRLAHKFAKEFRKHKSEFSEEVQKEGERVLALFETQMKARDDKKAKKAEKKAKAAEKGEALLKRLAAATSAPDVSGKDEKRSEATTDASKPLSLDDFAQSLSRFTVRLRDLKAKKPSLDEAEALVQLMKAKGKELHKDKEKFPTTNMEKFKDRGPSKHTPTFDFNRSGRDIEGAFINGTDISFGPTRKYIVTGLPRDIPMVQDFFDIALKQGITLFASAHQFNEATERAINLFKNEVLSQLTLRDGWSITNESEAVIEMGKDPIIPEHFPLQVSGLTDEQRKMLTPHIVENRLVARNKVTGEERSIINLHFIQWLDHEAAPEDMLVRGLDHMDAIQQKDPSKPFVTNCKGGHGRSGSIAFAYDLRRQIDEQLAKGIPLDEVEINIPRSHWNFYQQRSLVGRAAQLSALYDVTNAYYERLKRDAAAVN